MRVHSRMYQPAQHPPCEGDALAPVGESAILASAVAVAPAAAAPAAATATDGVAVFASASAATACDCCCSSSPSEVVHRIKNSNTCPGDAPAGTCMSIRIVSPESCAPTDIHAYIILAPTSTHFFFLDKQAQQHIHFYKTQFIPILMSEGR